MAEEDLFQSTETFEDADPVQAAEPTHEQIIEEQFESGVAQSFGEAKEEAKQEEKPSLIAGLTEDELKEVIEKAKRFDELDDRLTKTHDKAFGTIGQIQQTINELKQSRSVGAGIQVSKDAFKAVAEYFGDEALAEAFANDLSGLQLGASGGIDDEKFDAKVTAIEQKFERKLLTIVHPDWEEISATEDFAAWQNTLKPEDRALLSETWDGLTLAKGFTQFKAWRDKKAEAEQKKQQRLEGAMTVPGRNSRQQSNIVEDAFTAGLNKALKR